jgi:hypothetical protein
MTRLESLTCTTSSTPTDLNTQRYHTTRYETAVGTSVARALSDTWPRQWSRIWPPIVTERNGSSLTRVNIAQLRNGDSIFGILFMPDRNKTVATIHNLAAAARCPMWSHHGQANWVSERG